MLGLGLGLESTTPPKGHQPPPHLLLLLEQLGASLMRCLECCLGRSHTQFCAVQGLPSVVQGALHFLLVQYAAGGQLYIGLGPIQGHLGEGATHR